MTTHNRSESKRDTTYGIAIGLAIGAGAGAALGVLMGNIALGIALGTGIGVALGASIPSARRGKTQAHENTRRSAKNKTAFVAFVSMHTHKGEVLSQFLSCLCQCFWFFPFFS